MALHGAQLPRNERGGGERQHQEERRLHDPAHQREAPPRADGGSTAAGVGGIATAPEVNTSGSCRLSESYWFRPTAGTRLRSWPLQTPVPPIISTAPKT